MFAFDWQQDYSACKIRSLRSLQFSRRAPGGAEIAKKGNRSLRSLQFSRRVPGGAEIAKKGNRSLRSLQFSRRVPRGAGIAEKVSVRFAP